MRKTENVIFVEGEAKNILPRQQFKGDVDLVLLDGPHAYPLPQIEFGLLLSPDQGGRKAGGGVFHFLEKESSVVLEEVAVRTAFFRRVRPAERGPDGWALEGMNQHTILRYSLRDRLRRLLGKS